MEPTKECRICYDEELAVDDEWISPCRCDGSMKWVHRKCLDHWRQLAPTRKGKHQCPTCKALYRGGGWNPVRWLTSILVESKRRPAEFLYLYFATTLLTGMVILLADPSSQFQKAVACAFYLFELAVSLLFAIVLMGIDLFETD